MGMNVFGAIPALALAAAGVPAMGGEAAANPVSTQPLAANEVLVELTATGEAVTRADLATVTVQFVCRGATDGEARRAHDARVEQIRAAARSAGAAATDIEAAPGTSMGMMADFVDVDMRMPEDVGVEEPAETAAPPPASYVVSGEVTVRLRDPARVPALERALREVDETMTPNVAYSATDDTTARRQARAQAIAAARADAEAYAAALGLRVVRVVRVTERVGMDLMSMLISNPQLAAEMERGMRSEGPDIPVQVVVGVDFALAPR